MEDIKKEALYYWKQVLKQEKLRQSKLIQEMKKQILRDKSANTKS